jgi:class 3 adenylate cyclase
MIWKLQVRDRIALVLFVVLWIPALYTKATGMRRPAARYVWVRGGGAGEYPVVRGYINDEAKAATGLRVGDRVITVGARDMRGAGQLRFEGTVSDASWRASAKVPFVVERGGARTTVEEPLPASAPPVAFANLVISLASAICAILILLRARATTLSRRLFFALGNGALLDVAGADGTWLVWGVSLLLGALTLAAHQTLFIRAFLSFPEEIDSYRGWNRVWPWAFAVVGIPVFAAYHAVPMSPETGRALATPAVLAYIAAVAGALTVNFRKSGPVGRRQIKWIVYSTYVGVVLVLISFTTSGIGDLHPPLWTIVLRTVAQVMFPVVVLIAALRFDLLDINRLFGATVSYNLAGVFVVGSGLFVTPRITTTLTSSMDLDPTIGRTVMAVVLGFVVILAERRLRPRVDRLFFKERFALEQAIKDLPEKFASIRRPDDLWALTGAELVANLRPESCVIFVSGGDSYVPVFTDGDTRPPAIPTGTPLVEWLSSLKGAVKIERKSVAGAGEAGTAVLTALGAQVAFPIHRGSGLEAFDFLGEKKSGDIYTSTDLTLLTSLGRTLSSHMLRFDEAELLERAQAIQGRMRRYVPGAVADAIAQGEELETGEREVSVLFVDIRGYTSFSDGRQATDIFSTVNRYTETVSTIVNRRGGVVVEFNGDGMMAVFGAPRPLEQKERAAVLAARDLIAAVPAIQLGEASNAPLSVGVGVATGIAYVGNIEAADRTIWSAIGSTTNLAARLQSLTREMNAGVLIDATTHARAGEDASAFVKHSDVAIRGRKLAETLFALPNREVAGQPGLPVAPQIGSQLAT